YAVARLHEVIDVLRLDQDNHSREPDSIEALLQQAHAAGAEIIHTGVDDELYDQTTRRHLYQILREGLTNATRHAQGQKIHIDISPSIDPSTGPREMLTVTIRNTLIAAPSP